MPISRSVHLCLHPVAWLVVLLVYMLIGGGIFQAIESDEKRYEWSYVDSCMFAMSVFTTTGYGFLIPITRGGKILTVFYAIVGIPIFLKYLQVCGTSLNLLYNLIVSKFCLRASPRHTRLAKLLAAIFMLAIYHPLSALFHLRGNDWEFLDSIYYIFISVSTIGFGDLVYTGGEFFNETENHTANKVISMFVLFIGYAFLGGVLVAAWNVINTWNQRPSDQFPEHPHEIHNPLQFQEMNLVSQDPEPPTYQQAKDMQ